MSEQELIYTIALTRISNFNFATALELYRRMGSATAIYEHRNDIGSIIEDCSPRLVNALKVWDEPMKRAETEMEFIKKHNILALTPASNHYPQRLNECADAPLVLYYKGTADLNNAKVINIIGTRNCTIYGQDLIRRFCNDLKSMCPNVLIVSGLAYGVDIHAHRNALANGFNTVGVLAHGLDTIYPSAHRNTAKEMVTRGGLLTEFMTMTNADKVNFVRRNRIVAGVSDATILVESANKGGGLITCGIARSYSRDVYAFPGAVGAKYSEGCNRLIRDNEAALITSAEDFVNAMGWENDAKLQKAKEQGIERNLFPELEADEQQIVQQLEKTNDLQANVITVKTGLSISRVTALLFQLEMKGIVKPLAGGMYHLLK